MTKKFSVLLLFCILSALNIYATVYEGSCGSDVRYSLDTSTGVLSIKGTGAMADYNFYNAPWYSNRSYIKTVEISNGVTSIGYYAFQSCSGLTSVTIPNSVTSIGYYAFEFCSGLTSITIPNSVTSIGGGAFQYCPGLTSVTIGNSVTSIGGYAFYCCSGLTSVIIPNSVTSIGERAFSGCSGLTSISVESGNENYDSRNNCNAIIETASNTLIVGCNNTTIPASVTSIGYGAFFGCSGLTSVTIPNSVTSIGYYAFQSCSGLTSVTIPNSVTSIGDYAFDGCSGLTSVTIPNSVTSIGNHAFRGCSGLTSIEIPNSVTSIGDNAFNGCYFAKKDFINNSSLNAEVKNYWGATIVDSRNDGFVIKDGTLLKYTGKDASVTIPNSVTSIGNSAFEGCSELTSVTIPNSVTSIGNHAFSGCSGLTSVTIPNSVTSIGNYAFYGCSGLTEVYCDAENVPNTGSNAFQNVNLTNATLIVPESSVSAYKATSPWSGFGTIKDNGIYSGSCGTNVRYSLDTSTGLLSITGTGAMTNYTSYSYAPWYSNRSYIKTVEISNGVTSIGDYAFRGCSGLTSVTIGNSVTSIGSYAFSGCSGLIQVTLNNNDIVSKSYSSSSTLGSIFGNQVKEYVLGNEVIAIGKWAFSGCSGLTSIEIPNSVTSIGSDAFSDCSGLTSVTIPNSVTSIGNYAFYGTAFYNNQPEGLVYAGLVAYKYKGTMPENTSINIKEGTTAIADYAFYYCSGLTSVTIPNSVTSIGEDAFSGCSGLTSVTIPNSVTSIGDYAFQRCSGLTSVTIPNSVTSIGGSAFYNCSKLTSVTIPNSVTSIGDRAFYNCSKLTSVTIPNSVTSIGGSAFYECSSLKKLKVDKTTPINITSSIISTSSDAVLYVPKGSKSSYASANIWKNFKTIKEFPDGDVNWDEKTDVVDVVDIARFVVGTPRDAFDDFLADLNGSGSINVADAVVLVNEIAGDTQFARGLFRTPNHDDDVLSLSYNNDARLSMQLEGTERYTAFQFDLWLPSDMNLTDLSLNKLRSQGHQLLYNKVEDGHYRVVVMSTSRETFNGTSGELLSMMLDGFASDDIRIDNIHFVTNQGYDVPFDAVNARYAGTVTDIQSVEPASVEKQAIYNLSGQRLMSPRKGLNIVDGKKIIVK